MKRVITVLATIGFLVALVVPGCEDFLSNNPADDSNDGPAKLVLKITDSPFPVDMIDSAMVTITKVEIRNADSTDVDSIYPFVVVLEDTALTYNLMDLRNGVSAQMVEVEVPPGNYDLIRVYVEKASLTVKDGDTFTLKIPSGSQTGIKVFVEPAIRMAGGVLTEVILDFNLEKSFVLKGNMKTPAGIKGFNFKPVIHAINKVTSGSISGMVADTSDMPVKHAQVWLEHDTVFATAYADTTGHYGFIGVPAGTYDIYATGENYDTVGFMDIKIVEGNLFHQDFVLTPLDTATVGGE